jgi:hypothetical protein
MANFMGFFLNDYFVANGISLRKRISDLFDELEKNPELAQVFIRNPVLVLQSKVLPEFEVMGEDEIDAANQLLYSVLSNDKFMNWTQEYGAKLINQYNKTGKLPDKKKILRAFAKGIIEYGDERILGDLLDMPQNFNGSEGLVEHWWFYYHIVLAIEFFYIFVYDYIIVGANRISLLDEKQQIVTISPKELKSLAEQMIKYSKKMRETKQAAET